MTADGVTDRDALKAMLDRVGEEYREEDGPPRFDWLREWKGCASCILLGGGLVVAVFGLDGDDNLLRVDIDNRNRVRAWR